MANEIPSQYHFVFSPTATALMSGDEMPLNGFFRDGKIIKDLVDKNPSSDTNEWESGGVVFDQGSFEIKTFSELDNCSDQADRVEQAMLIFSDNNYEVVCNLPAYKK